MSVDPINDEILRIKRELAGQFNNDLDRIVADAKSRERNAICLPLQRTQPESIAVLPPSSASVTAGTPTIVNE